MRQLHRLAQLEKLSLAATDGEIGRIEEAYFDDRRWVVRYFVVRAGGWLLGRKVLLLPAMFKGVDESSGTIGVALTRKQIEDSPPLDEAKPVSRHYEEAYYRHYGWRPYWTEPTMLATAAPLEPRPQAAAEPVREPPDPHLRSSREVAGYRIRATDGEIGRVADFILGGREWGIRYLEIDTRVWLPGKHVLLAPAWISGVEWASKQVTVDLSRDAIESAPPHEPSQLITRDYELSLYKHYGRSFEDAA